MADETSSEFSNLGPGEEQTPPEDSLVQHVESLAYPEAEAVWDSLVIDLNEGTRSEVEGKLNQDQLDSLYRDREYASLLFKKLGRTNYSEALTLGLTDCIPDADWGRIKEAKISNPETQAKIAYFDKKREQEKDPPTSDSKT